MLTISRREDSSCTRNEGDAPRVIGRSRVKDERECVALVSDDPIKRMLQPVPPTVPDCRCTSPSSAICKLVVSTNLLEKLLVVVGYILSYDFISLGSL